MSWFRFWPSQMSAGRKTADGSQEAVQMQTLSHGVPSHGGNTGLYSPRFTDDSNLIWQGIPCQHTEVWECLRCFTWNRTKRQVLPLLLEHPSPRVKSSTESWSSTKRQVLHFQGELAQSSGTAHKYYYKLYPFFNYVASRLHWLFQSKIFITRF